MDVGEFDLGTFVSFSSREFINIVTLNNFDSGKKIMPFFSYHIFIWKKMHGLKFEIIFFYFLGYISYSYGHTHEFTSQVLLCGDRHDSYSRGIYFFFFFFMAKMLIRPLISVGKVWR